MASPVVHNDMLLFTPYLSCSLGTAAAIALRHIRMRAQNVGLIPRCEPQRAHMCEDTAGGFLLALAKVPAQTCGVYILGSNALRKNDKQHKIKLSRKHKVL